MNNIRRLTLLIITILSINYIQASSLNDSISVKTDSSLIFVFEIGEDIMPAMLRVTQQAFDEATRLNSDFVIIRMNTYGGMVNIADSIRTRILNYKKPVYIFIDNNAASAGALISIAGDRIYMRKGARIGAASVVNQTGEVMPEKYQSYMRSTMRATAEYHGKDTIIIGNDTIVKWYRDPHIAEAMVDPKIVVDGISDTGNIITFTADEAIEHGYCEGIAENVEAVISQAGIENYEIVRYERSTLDKLIGMLASPALQGILIMIIVGGIYFELQSPGIGFPLAASAVAALLYFAPLYMEGIAENWELAIFILGIILIAVEVFAIPGFGIAGISGIILVITGLVLGMIDNIIFDFEFYSDIAILIVLKALALVSFSMVSSLVLSIYLSKKLLTETTMFAPIVLSAKENTNEGYIGVDNDLKDLVGRTGIAATVLRPGGKIEIDDEIYEAKSEIGFIERGEKIKVISFSTNQLNVMKE